MTILDNIFNILLLTYPVKVGDQKKRRNYSKGCQLEKVVSPPFLDTFVEYYGDTKNFVLGLISNIFWDLIG